MRTRRLLLVEDNVQDCKLALRAFRAADVDLAVDVVCDGVEALDYLFCENRHADRKPCASPAVVLLDIGLPRLSGLEVLARLRGDERTRWTPIVMLTSSDELSDVEASYRLGANGYVRKPVAAAEFNRAVAQLADYWLKLNQTPAPLP